MDTITDEEVPELDHLAETDQLKGALVTVVAIGCRVDIAGKIVAHTAGCLQNQKKIKWLGPCPSSSKCSNSNEC